MKKDIILAGVGGQGILSIAAIIGLAAVNTGLFLKQAEVHGMSQRGGAVYSNLRLSDNEIASDLIPDGKADMILSLEPMESLRYLPKLAKHGWLITNFKPYINIPNYPAIESIINEIEKQPFHLVINANDIAKEVGSNRAANMVILGAAAPFLEIDYNKLEEAIIQTFGKKGQGVVDINLKAMNAGRKLALQKK
jgi:indolepyruvate ferredoxin oxidoreductase beta subunit